MEALNLKSVLRNLTRYVPRWVWDWLERSPVTERLMRGAFWSLAGAVISRVLALVSTVLAARILGKIAYGQLGMIQSTVGMFATCAGFGLGTTAARFVAELREKDPAKAGRIIALSSIVSWSTSSVLVALLVFLASWLCNHTLASPHLTSHLQISSALILVGGINGAQTGVLVGFESFKSIGRVALVAGILNFPLTIAGALLFGLPGVIWGMIVAQACGCLLNLHAVRREARRHGIPLSYSSCMRELPVLWQCSIPAVLTTLLINAVNWASAAMLFRQPNGYAEMGVFNAANQWFTALIWLPQISGAVALPILAERLGANDKAAAVGLLKTSVKMNLLTSLPLIALGCLLSPYIMMSYGEGFRSGWPSLVAALITAGLLSLDIPLGQLLTASGRMWTGLFTNIGWALVLLGTTSVLLIWGSFGLTTARLLAYFTRSVLVLAYSVFVVLAVRRTTRFARSQLSQPPARPDEMAAR